MNVSFSAKPLSEDGGDAVEFLLSVNPGEALKPLAKIASGGEMSRIMLGIKGVLSGREEIGTLIFDEIDAGISGRAASECGQMGVTQKQDTRGSATGPPADME